MTSDQHDCLASTTRGIRSTVWPAMGLGRACSWLMTMERSSIFSSLGFDVCGAAGTEKDALELVVQLKPPADHDGHQSRVA